jgi:hypothetical protein
MLSPNPESVFPEIHVRNYETSNRKFYLMAESGKPKWFHILGPKPSSKHQNGIIGPFQHIRLFAILVFRKSKNLKSR